MKHAIYAAIAVFLGTYLAVRAYTATGRHTPVLITGLFVAGIVGWAVSGRKRQ